MFFDTHVHFDGIEVPGGAAALVERAGAAGVTRMVAIGGEAERNALAVEVAAADREHLRAAVGYDRDCAATCDGTDDALEALLAGGPPVVAVGEIGLDYHYHPNKKEAQRKLFTNMLAAARRHTLPVVVHSREAEADTLELLGEHARAWGGAADRIGVLHCFTGGPVFADRLVDAGYYVSFSGIVTFRNADSVRDAARIVPDDRLLIETDAPYLAPVPHRGKPNEPAWVVHVAELLAEVRGTDVETIAATTFANASRLFGWDAHEVRKRE